MEEQIKKAGFSPASHLPILHKLRLQLHRSETVNLAVDIMIAVNQADAFHFRALLQDRRTAFHFQILDDGHGIPVLQDIAIGILYDFRFFNRFVFRSRRPLMRTFRAHELAAVFIHVFGIALRAVW